MGQMMYAGANYIREKAKVDAARITQKSGNERRGAESDLQRWSQSLGNQRIRDQAGKQVNALTENVARNLDAAAVGTAMSRVAVAEELGGVAAMAAAAGAGGSSVELYNETVRLSSAMQEELSDRAVNSDLVSASQARAGIIQDAVAGFDQNVYRADMDYTQYVDPKKPSTLGNLMTLGLAAAATYVGGPQAGQAIIGLRESKLAADRGDFDSASRSLTGAFQNGISAVKTVSSLQDKSNPGMESYWGSTRRKMSGVKIDTGFAPMRASQGGYISTTLR